jgi:hypothetical protein
MSSRAGGLYGGIRLSTGASVASNVSSNDDKPDIGALGTPPIVAEDVAAPATDVVAQPTATTESATSVGTSRPAAGIPFLL